MKNRKGAFFDKKRGVRNEKSLGMVPLIIMIVRTDDY